MKMEDTPKKLIPSTMEGIAIHLGYMNDHLNSLDKKMDAVAGNTVNRDEWMNHLKRDEDHEARIRFLESKIEEQKSQIESYEIVRKLVYGCVALILSAVIGAIVYLVVKR